MSRGSRRCLDRSIPCRPVLTGTVVAMASAVRLDKPL